MQPGLAEKRLRYFEESVLGLLLHNSVDTLTVQAGTDSDPEQLVEVQNVRSSERQHQVDPQQSNSDFWLQPAELG